METTALEFKEYYLYAAADCDIHGIEHVVGGHTREKQMIGRMKQELEGILRGDWPGCGLRPKGVYVGYRQYKREAKAKNGVWSDLIKAPRR